MTTWATITVSSTGTHTLTIDSTQFPTHFSSAVSETLTVETTLDTWSVTNTASTVTVNLDPTACDCSALAWTAPAITVASVNIDATSTPTIPAPNSDTSATSSNFAFANCYEDGNTCATTGSYAAISDFTVDDGTGAVSLTGHAFLSWDVSSQTMTAAPTLVSQAGTYVIAATYTPTYGTSSSAPVLTLTVKCVVTSFASPANPTTGLTQYIKGAAIEFDLA